MPKSATEKEIAIIGAGPAGLAASIYAQRAEKSLALLDYQQAGGKLLLSSLIENYPGFPDGIGGIELAERIKEQTQKLGITIDRERALSVKKEGNEFNVFLSGRSFKTKAVIIATGSSPKKLNIPNEDKLIGRGVSFCATCDGPFFRDKVVAVIGGGNSALEEALFLTKFAKKVYLIHRRETLRAVSILQDRAKRNKKIEFLLGFIPKEIVGDNRVEAVSVRNKKTNKLMRLKVDGLFIYAGSKPNSELVGDLVKTDEEGFIITDSNLETSYRRMYAAGDVRSGSFKQIISACAEGALAAKTACK
jgi:thioredoxin reductase (NADPH)